MSNNPPARTSSQIVYTSVDDDMTITEIICDYDGEGDDAVPEAVCEVEAPDLTQAHIYIDESAVPKNNPPEPRKQNIIMDTDGVTYNATIKEEKIYFDDALDDPEHQIFSDDKKFKCGVCSEQFDDLPTISRHMEEHSGEKKYECAECGKQFKNINNVMRHMVVHSGEKKYICPICRKHFTQVGNLKRHMFVHSGEKKFSCTVCNKGFTQMNNLIRHQAIHSGLKSFQCNMCPRSFNQASNLSRHMLIHKGIKLFKCALCGRAFSQLTNLQKHQERHMRGKKYKCNLCTEGFDLKLVYNKHLESHFGKPRYQCNVCGRVVTQKSTLNQHMLLHIETKKYTCPQCQRCYAQKGSLSKHMESHNQVKYHCKICNRYFYDESGLTKHEATHTEKAKSLATHSEKANSLSGNDEEQVKIPEYDLQFCLECGKSFILKRSLRRHMEKVHGVIVDIQRKVSCRENPCGVCGKVFVHRKSLKKHMARKHATEIEFDTETLIPSIKMEKENITEDTEEDRVLEIPDIDRSSIAETLLQIKQENVIEAETTLDESRQVWNDITSPGTKEDQDAKPSRGATVHLCEICGRGYYLVSNLRRHMQIKHGIDKEKEKDGAAANNTESVELVNNFILKQSVGPNKEKEITVNKSDVKDQDVTSFEHTRSPLKSDSVRNPLKSDSTKVKATPKRGRPQKQKFRYHTDADICDICGRGFLTPFDLLLHMLEHSKDKKDELLRVVNEAAQEMQTLKKSEVELSITEKTKDLLSHFKKYSRDQSIMSNIFSMNDTVVESLGCKAGSSKIASVNNIECGKESIVAEYLDLDLDFREKVIEINEDDEGCVRSVSL